MVYTIWRPKEGVGDYLSLVEVPVLAIVAPAGRESMLTSDIVRETVVRHIMETMPPDKWSPKIGDRESVVRAALEDNYSTRGGSAAALIVAFDGQFGPVVTG
jgi:hypothetical protein